MLTHRLAELEWAGVLRRRQLGPPGSAQGYELTDRGIALEPVLPALGRWTSAAVFRALVFGGEPLPAAEDAGLVTVRGNRAAADRLLTLFPRPGTTQAPRISR